MARFFALSFRTGSRGFRIPVVVVGLSSVFSVWLHADAPRPTPTQVPAPAPKQAQVSSIAPAPNVPPGVPTPLPDTFERYGKIVAIGNEPSHPLKLNLPFPSVGEVKIPNQDELIMREKLDQLTVLSDADIRAQLEQWPAYGKMSLKDEGALLQRIQDFRDRRARIAMEKAHQMGLLTLTPDQQARFEKEYWNKRLQMDRDLATQFDPIVKDHEQKLQDDLLREFSSPTPLGPVVQAAKPSSSSPTQPSSSSSPVSAQNKPLPSPVPLGAKPSPTPPAPMAVAPPAH